MPHDHKTGLTGFAGKPPSLPLRLIGRAGRRIAGRADVVTGPIQVAAIHLPALRGVLARRALVVARATEN